MPATECKCAELLKGACSNCYDQAPPALPASGCVCGTHCAVVDGSYGPGCRGRGCVEPERLCGCGESPTGTCDGTCDRLLMGIGPADPGEVRVTDPDTGGEKGQKVARFDLIPKDFLWAFAEHYGRGAAKYAERNWEKGYKWSLSFAALQRHATALEMGEDIDPETGSHHALAVAWHAASLYAFWNRGLGTDDRVTFVDEQTGEAAW